ncbi:cation transporter [bacterium]|nr:cation transporter [bacterium]
MPKTEDNVADIKRVTWFAVFLNLTLSALKFVVGYLGASQAVIADAVHSLSDMTTDFAVILGIRFWSAPPDEKHPYGHRRIEALITVAIAFSMAAIAIGLGYNAIVSFNEIRQTTWIAAIGPLFSIILKELLYHRTIFIGKKTGSPAVVANAWHHRSDALSSVPALIAVVAASIDRRLAFLDGIGAMIIAGFILKIAWDIAAPSLSELIDRGASPEKRQRIYEIAKGVDGVLSVHAIRTRRFGQNLCVDLHVLVDPQMSVLTGHKISENVKSALIEKGPAIVDVVVHLEPFGNDPDVT